MMEERKCQDGILKMLVTTSHNISQHLILRHPLCIHQRSQTLNPQHHTLFRQVSMSMRMSVSESNHE